MTTSALRTWAQARSGQSKKPVSEATGPLPKKKEEPKKDEKPKEKKPPRQWHDDPEKHDLPKETHHHHYEENGKDPKTGKPSTNPDHGATPKEARKSLIHDPIVANAFAGKKPVPEGKKKIAIMTMGAPASGKSSGLRTVDLKRFVSVDPDGIKEKLPEYKKATEDREKTFKGAALMAHEESSAIAKRITKEAIEKGHNVLIDGTGANAASMKKKIAELKKAGYHVHVVMSHLHEDEGVRRAKARAEQTGREVPEGVIRSAYKSVPKNFAAIGKEADSFHVMDNRSEGGKIVWSKIDGEEHHHDPHFVRLFKAEHGGTDKK